MKLTESANIFYISEKVASTIKRNIKETFLENNSFARIQGWKDGFLLLYHHSGKLLDSY